MSDEGHKKKPTSKPRKLVPNVTGRHRKTIKKDSKHSTPSQKRSAAFEELVEAAQKESKWERGAGRSRHSSYKSTSSVAFGATTSMPRVSNKTPVWTQPLEIKQEEQEFEEELKIEPEVDRLGPLKLPLKTPDLEEGNLDHRNDSAKLLPQFFERKLNSNNRTQEEDTSIRKILNLDNSERGQPVLFQLPSVLPVPVRKDDGSTEVIPGTLSDLQDGEIGELLIYKSGKVKLKLGTVLLDISAGTPTPFHQQLVAINCGEEDGHCVFLGDIKHRAICSYNIPQLLNPEALNPVKIEPKTEQDDPVEED